MTDKRKAIRKAATDDDIRAAKNWDYITNEAHGWNESAIEQFMAQFCEFSAGMERLKDELDLTYSEIADALNRRR